MKGKNHKRDKSYRFIPDTKNNIEGMYDMDSSQLVEITGEIKKTHLGFFEDYFLLVFVLFLKCNLLNESF